MVRTMHYPKMNGSLQHFWGEADEPPLLTGPGSGWPCGFGVAAGLAPSGGALRLPLLEPSLSGRSHRSANNLKLHHQTLPEDPMFNRRVLELRSASIVKSSGFREI